MITMAALNGEVVTEAHANKCATDGHAYYVIDGVNQEWCPRCGEDTSPVEETKNEKEFNKILDQEFAVKRAQAGYVGGADENMRDLKSVIERREARKHDYMEAQAKLFRMIESLGMEGQKAYGEWRKGQELPVNGRIW